MMELLSPLMFVPFGGSIPNPNSNMVPTQGGQTVSFNRCFNVSENYLAQCYEERSFEFKMNVDLFPEKRNEVVFPSMETVFDDCMLIEPVYNKSSIGFVSFTDEPPDFANIPAFFFCFMSLLSVFMPLLIIFLFLAENRWLFRPILIYIRRICIRIFTVQIDDAFITEYPPRR